MEGIKDSKGIFIDFENYSNNPEDLIAKAKEFAKENNFEPAFEILTKAIEIKLVKVIDRLHPDLLIFYMTYADVLIQKLIQSDEILMKDNKNYDNKETSKNKQNDEGEEEEEDEDEDDADDEEIAYDHLFASQKIIQDKLKEFEHKDIKDLEGNETFKSLQFKLSEVYILFAQLEVCKSDNKSAIPFYQKAADIRKRYDDKFSRALGEIYYDMGLSYDYNVKLCFTSFYKVKIIMEYHLQEQISRDLLGKTLSPIFFHSQEEELLDKEVMNHKEIKLNKVDILENQSDSHEIKDLKEILQEIYLKIEDSIIGIDSDEELNIAKEEQKAETQEQIGFSTVYDDSKVLNINSIVKKKKPIENQASNMINIDSNLVSKSKTEDDDIVIEPMIKKIN